MKQVVACNYFCKFARLLYNRRTQYLKRRTRLYNDFHDPRCGVAPRGRSGYIYVVIILNVNMHYLGNDTVNNAHFGICSSL